MGTTFHTQGGGAAASDTGQGTKKQTFYLRLSAGHLRAAPLTKAAEAQLTVAIRSNSMLSFPQITVLSSSTEVLRNIHKPGLCQGSGKTCDVVLASVS